MRAALAKGGFVRRSQRYFFTLALAQLNTVEAIGFAKATCRPSAVALAKTQGRQAQGQGWPGQRTAEGWQSPCELPGWQCQGDGLGNSFGPISGSRHSSQGDAACFYPLDAFGRSARATELAWGLEQVTRGLAACDPGNHRLPRWRGPLDRKQNVASPRLLPDSCEERVTQSTNSETRVLGKLVRFLGQARQDMGWTFGGEGPHPTEFRHGRARMGAEAQRGVGSLVKADSSRQAVGYHFGELGGHGRGRGDGESGDPTGRGATEAACRNGSEGGCHLRGPESSKSGRSGKRRHGHADGQRKVSQAAQSGGRPGSQAGGVQEGAPWLGPTCSLMGDVGPTSLGVEPGLPRRHTVEHEPDFTAPPMAGVLGLRREYEVELTRLGIHTTYEFDDRILQYEADCHATRTFMVDVATASCDPLQGAFRSSGKKSVPLSIFLDPADHMDKRSRGLDAMGGALLLARDRLSSQHLRPAISRPSEDSVHFVHSVCCVNTVQKACRKRVSFAMQAEFFEPAQCTQSLSRHVSPVACTVTTAAHCVTFHLPRPPSCHALPEFTQATRGDTRPDPRPAASAGNPCERHSRDTSVPALTGPQSDQDTQVQVALQRVPPASRCLYTVFEHRMDHLSRGALSTWGQQEFTQDAMRAIPYPLRSVHFINAPMPELPTPQLVLTDDLTPVGHFALPVDLRPANGLVHTLTVPPTGSAELLWELLRGKGVDPDLIYCNRWSADQCHFCTAAGDRVEVWDFTSGIPVPEWVTLRMADRSTLADIDYVGGPERTLRVPRRVPSPGRATASFSRGSTHPYQRPRAEAEHVAARPFWPSEVARILAQHVEVTPQHLAGPLQQIPLDRLVDFDPPLFDEISQRGRYTVFEVGERPRSRPLLSGVGPCRLHCRRSCDSQATATGCPGIDTAYTRLSDPPGCAYAA